MIASVNPATGATVRTYEALPAAEVEGRIGRAADAFQRYRRTTHEQRARWLEAAAALLESQKRRWAELMTLEMGKPIGAAVAEAEKCAWVCRHYAERGARLLADRPVRTDARRSYVRYEPLGPVLAVMPWNFPFWQLFRFAAPALAAGNVILLKHATSVPGCALAIESIIREAGFPDDVLQALLVEVDQVEAILDDTRVRAVTLTGSVGAGRAVGGAAGSRILPSVLELGGSDPFIVLPSADLDAAVATAVRSRMVNNGQSCIAAKRFIVHADVYAEFEARFVAAVAALKVGDPTDPDTDIGPLAAPGLRDELDRQARESVAAGARLLTGGTRGDGPGFYYMPTVIADPPPGSPAYDEELFGPVATLFEAADLDAAIALANATEFGLGSSVWTADAAERDRCIAELEAGQVFVNGMVASDPRVPFGGVKRSGYGRELGDEGIYEFTNVKTVWIGD